jgi:hypothetical protein
MEESKNEIEYKSTIMEMKNIIKKNQETIIEEMIEKDILLEALKLKSK